MSGVERVQGREITIVFEGAKCIHSRGCVLSRPDVFVPNVEGEWIHPDAASAAEVVEIAHNCPSGAIRYEDPRDRLVERPPLVNTVRIREAGPLAFHAELRIGATQAIRATLCRCGASGNKPWCDGSHHAAGFAASGEPEPAVKVQPSAQRGGPLAVTAIENGPLIASGTLEIVSGTGRTLARTGEAALCRCGHSGNKPFCDGSHAGAGFKAAPV